MSRLTFGSFDRTRFARQGPFDASPPSGGVSFHVGSSNLTPNGSLVTSFSVPVPGSAATDDLIIICLMYVLDQTITSTSSAYTQLGTRTTAVGSSYCEIWYRFRQSGDGSTADFTVSGGGVAMAATSNAFRGVASVGSNSAKVSAASSSDVTVPSFTTTNNDSYVVYFGAGDNGDSGRNYTDPQSTLTTHQRINSSAGTYLQQYCGSKLQAVAGATGTQLITASGTCNRHGRGMELVML